MREIAPAITVIMLTYNREKWVARAIESVLGQSFEDFQYIIVDNGSADASGQIADAYAKKDGRIQVIHTPKLNIGQGRQTGLDATKSDFVLFIDDDDSCEADMLEFLHGILKENDADIAVCGMTKMVDGEAQPADIDTAVRVMSPEEAVTELLRRKLYNNALIGKLYRKNLFDGCRFSPSCRFDDISMSYRLYAKARCTVYCGLSKYTVCRHESNHSIFTTNSTLWTGEKLDEYLEAFRERTLFIAKELPAAGEYALYSEWSYMISMCDKITTHRLAGCEAQLAHIQKELTLNAEKFMASPYIQQFEREWMQKYIIQKG